MDPMLESFITESRENLETAGRCFLELEKTPGDVELMNDLFRSMHTIKGSSGLFDIPAFTKVVHAGEDVLDTVRSGELTLSSEHIDLFLDMMDQVSAWLVDLESAGALSEGAESNSQSLTEALRSLLGEVDATESTDNETNVTGQDSSTEGSMDKTNLTAPPDWLDLMPAEKRLPLFKHASDENLDITLLEYTPEPQCFFSGDDPLHTVRSLAGLVWFHVQVRDEWPAAEEMDPYQCNLNFYAVVVGKQEDTVHYLRYIPEQTQLTKLNPIQLVMPTGKMGDNEPFEGFISEAPAIIEKQDWQQLQRFITPLLEMSGPELLHTSVLQWMSILLQKDKPDSILLAALLNTLTTGFFEWSDSLVNEMNIRDNGDDQSGSEDALPQPVNISKKISPDKTQPNETQLSETQLKAMAQALATQQKILTMPCSTELLPGRIASVSMVVKNLLNTAEIPLDDLNQAIEQAQQKETTQPLAAYLADLNLDPTTPIESVSEVVTTAASSKEKNDRRENDRRQGDRRQDTKLPVSEPTTTQNKTLKVDQQRIDALMDLVGELVVAKNALPFLAKRAEVDFGVHELAKEITSQYAVINRLSEELQSTMMQVRMVPVSNVFQRFPRLVRDLSRKLDKNISLVLEGEDTEADKNVVENLADPLIHLVRNSLDHGLELPNEREAVGKPAQGTLTLRAIPNDDQVIIEVADDGQGIDPDIIKRKAYEKGIIDEQRLDNISNHEALQLILAPGFSTAEEISDLSGRGVGMDVVHSVVNQAGGTVLVDSEKGKGSTVRLSLPLSMAVTQVMMIEVAEQSYGISMEHIVETVRIPASSIERIKHNEAVVLRDRLIPLFHLRELLQLAPVSQLPEEVAVLVMRLDGEEVGLIIDAFHEGIDIIQKPLEGVMSHYPYYSGAALLGDGRVLLVLNSKELLACR